MVRYYSFLALLLFFACNASKTGVKTQTIDPIMHFDEAMQDLGRIKKGESRELTYTFTNTGKEDLVIELASGCHCSEITAPEGKVFKPGEKGAIKVIYHSKEEEELGPHEKVIDILLEMTDPKTGYQIIKEVKYKVIVEERA